LRILLFITTLFCYNRAMTIEELRKSKGLTQAQAAVLLKMPLRTYQNYESPRISPTSWRARFIEKELRAYEPYNEKQGILTLPQIKAIAVPIFKAHRIEFAYLFGSYAKGTPQGSSDVDLFIKGPDDGLAFFKLIEELRQALHKKVDLVRYQDMSPTLPIFCEILKTGVKIFGS
jgi:predicted nucleotidyltransferase